MTELDQAERDALLADPRVQFLLAEATVEGERRGYEWGTQAGYVTGRSVGFTEGYETHKDEAEQAWDAAWVTNDELRIRHQEWMNAGPPKDPNAPDLRPHDLTCAD